MIVVDEKKCVGCGICVCACPADALNGMGTIEVDRDKCSECLECIDYCPVDALEVRS